MFVFGFLFDVVLGSFVMRPLFSNSEAEPREREAQEHNPYQSENDSQYYLEGIGLLLQLFPDVLGAKPHRGHRYDDERKNEHKVIEEKKGQSPEIALAHGSHEGYGREVNLTGTGKFEKGDEYASEEGAYNDSSRRRELLYVAVNLSLNRIRKLQEHLPGSAFLAEIGIPGAQKGKDQRCRPE